MPSPDTWKAGGAGGAPGPIVVTCPAVTSTVTFTLTTTTIPSSTAMRVTSAGVIDTWKTVPFAAPEPLGVWTS